jgi:hypothetical protein
MVEKVLQRLEMYRDEKNRETLQAAARQISSIKTWGGMKGFVNLLGNQGAQKFMLYPIGMIESLNKQAFLETGKLNWKIIKKFQKDFTKENGAFRWPVSDDTEITRQHLGAICGICSHPDFGRKLWDGYAMLALYTGEKDAAHDIGMAYYRALYFSLPELPKREKK